MKSGIKKVAVRNAFFKNMLLVGVIATAGIAGYLLLVRYMSNSDVNQIPPITDPTNEGGNIIPGSQMQCKAGADEFPLQIGAGYNDRANKICEQEYVKNVQRYLNYYTNLGFSTLTVDGKLGNKTMDAFKKRFDSHLGTYNEISLSAYKNITTELLTL